jgi:hypothetical protein
MIGRARRGRTRRGVNSAVARGLADGFNEASQAFSEEVVDTSTCSDLIENLFAGTLRANGRFLEELATLSRRVTDDLTDNGSAGGPLGDFEYSRLADLIAARVVKMQVAVTTAATSDQGEAGATTPSRQSPEIDYERLADLIADRLAPQDARPG